VPPQRPPDTEPTAPPARPWLAQRPSLFMLLEREVEQQFRARQLEALQEKVNTLAEATGLTRPDCPHCEQPMAPHDTRSVSCWPASGACELPFPAIVVPTAATSAGPCWMCWAWSPGA